MPSPPLAPPTGPVPDPRRARAARTAIALVVVTLLHAGASLAMLSLAAMAALERVETDTPPGLRERLLDTLTLVLWYPLAGPLMDAFRVPVGWSQLLLLANSALWAVVLVFGGRAAWRRLRPSSPGPLSRERARG